MESRWAPPGKAGRTETVDLRFASNLTPACSHGACPLCRAGLPPQATGLRRATAQLAGWACRCATTCDSQRSTSGWLLTVGRR